MYLKISNYIYEYIFKGYSVRVEKKRPTHDLSAFKACVSNIEKLNITVTAARSAASLGYTFQDIVDTIQKIERRHFHKSMTSHADNQSWQDVYYVPTEELTLYVKFTDDVVTEFKVLSFKGKEYDW